VIHREAKTVGRNALEVVNVAATVHAFLIASSDVLVHPDDVLVARQASIRAEQADAREALLALSPEERAELL